MRKILLLMAFVTAVVFAASADKYTLDREQLPETAREMLTKHFPGKKVGMIKVDRHLLRKTDYDVRLTDGTKIEFNPSGKWTSVRMKKGAVPSGLVLRAIRNYVNKNHKGVDITEITKKRNGAYELKLSDGVELKFNALGGIKKVGVDD